MSGHEWEIAVLVAGAVIYGFINTLFRRAENTGVRMGRLEKANDYREGYQAGYEAGLRAREATQRGSNVR